MGPDQGIFVGEERQNRGIERMCINTKDKEKRGRRVEMKACTTKIEEGG
jgi:hypothetical protein